MAYKSLCLVLCLALFTMEAHGYNRYVAYRRSATFFQAWQLCRLHGGHLATIETAEENARVEQAIKAVGQLNMVWIIGGTDLGAEGNFIWVGLNKKITYTNFNSWEPNGGTAQNCLAVGMSTVPKWNDINCSQVHDGYVCGFTTL
uniref:C-type lectin domain-containing protein n=1 Tax=Anopheles funestus TaxID=62324 RepID=A0A4Y0BJ82_ANOFN